MPPLLGIHFCRKIYIASKRHRDFAEQAEQAEHAERTFSADRYCKMGFVRSCMLDTTFDGTTPRYKPGVGTAFLPDALLSLGGKNL